MNYLLTGQRTERLRFRSLQEDDFDDWKPLFEHADTAKFLGMDPNLDTQRLCELWFEKSSQREKEQTGGMNVLEHKETGELIGQSGILVQNIEGKRRIEVGYSILPKFWRQGYAFEAANACLNQAFEWELDDSVISIVHHENVGSARVAQKNGMQVERYIESFEGGDPVNIYSIHRDRWRQLV